MWWADPSVVRFTAWPELATTTMHCHHWSYKGTG